VSVIVALCHQNMVGGTSRSYRSARRTTYSLNSELRLRRLRKVDVRFVERSTLIYFLAPVQWSRWQTINLMKSAPVLRVLERDVAG